MIVYLDKLSQLTSPQITKINSIVNSESKRFQRKAYQKENKSEPLVSSTIRSSDNRVYSLTTRTYNELTTASCIVNTDNMEKGKGYIILTSDDKNMPLSSVVFDSKDSETTINDAIVYMSGNNIIFSPNTFDIKKQYYVYLFYTNLS